MSARRCLQGPDLSSRCTLATGTRKKAFASLLKVARLRTAGTSSAQSSCLYPSNNKEGNRCAAIGVLYALDTFTGLVTHIAHGQEGKPDINPTYPESSNLASESSPKAERQVECGWPVLTYTVSTHQAPRIFKHTTHSYRTGNAHVWYVQGCCLPNKPEVARGDCAWATDRQVGLFQNTPRSDALSVVCCLLFVACCLLLYRLQRRQVSYVVSLISHMMLQTWTQLWESSALEQHRKTTYA